MALVLQSIINETPSQEMVGRFGKWGTADKVRDLQIRSSTRAGMVCKFLTEIRDDNLALLCGDLSDRLKCGVKEELRDLVAIRGISSRVARALYNKKCETVEQVAELRREQVVEVVEQAYPAQSRHRGIGAVDIDREVHSVMAGMCVLLIEFIVC